MTDVTLIDVDGFPVYGITCVPGEWEQANGNPGFVTFHIYGVVGVDDDKTAWFWQDDGNPTCDVTEADPCGEVMVRWDGRVGVFVNQDDSSNYNGEFDALLGALQRAVELGTEMVAE